MRLAVFASLLVLSLFLAGCGEESSSKDKNTVDIWVQTSKESPEGEVMYDTVAFNEDTKVPIRPILNSFLEVVAEGGMKIKSMLPCLQELFLMCLLWMDRTLPYAEADIIAPIGEYLTDKTIFCRVLSTKELMMVNFMP